MPPEPVGVLHDDDGAICTVRLRVYRTASSIFEQTTTGLIRNGEPGAMYIRVYKLDKGGRYRLATGPGLKMSPIKASGVNLHSRMHIYLSSPSVTPTGRLSRPAHLKNNRPMQHVLTDSGEIRDPPSPR
jgi:hypothetical protein